MLDERKLPSFTEAERVELCRRLTDSVDGLLGGADGVLLVSESDAGAAGRMRVLNADGTEASMCGNGLRVVARYLHETDSLPDFFQVQTMVANLHVGKAASLAAGVPTYRVEISPVSFSPEALRLNREQPMVLEKIPEFLETLRFTALSVPNPHLISFVDSETFSGSLLEEVALFLNGENPYFADGVNVTFVEKLDAQMLDTRTFERGVGLTNACGTAMSAASLVDVLYFGGELEKELTVYNPGGLVKTLVHQRADASYFMELIGNATVTHFIVGELSELLSGVFANVSIEETTEQESYQTFLKQIK